MIVTLATLALAGIGTLQAAAPQATHPGIWACYGGSAQHRSIAPAPAQPLRRILWWMPVDLAPQYGSDDVLATHYGSPVITAKNTIIVPVKVGAEDGFRVEARNAATGDWIYRMDTDYSTVSAAGWIASFSVALAPNNSLFVPASAGTVYVKHDADKANDGPERAVFYGGDNYKRDPDLYTNNVKVCTPITVDPKNNAWYGFRTYGNNDDETPIGNMGLMSGIARVDATGNGAWRSAKAITGDPDAMRVQFQCAPAISDDGNTVYFAIQRRDGGGYL